ncbi:MAG: M23 family metallopeptidase [Solirubrobacterales bacterium]|nr:M23 family metallopeptidase [Solirubrobacterales bacterium]
MSTTLTSRCALAAFALAFAAPVSPAGAHTGTGGASFGARPTVKSFECVGGGRSQCPEGELLRVRGEGLERADSVIFLGRNGGSDDRRARPAKRSPHRVVVRVPSSARTGPVRVVSRAAGASRASKPKRLRVIEAPAPAAQPAPVVPAGEGVFPVRARHDFGTRTNRFGGGRGHQGQDVFAPCGTPLVAALSGVVTWAKFQARAGNYAVIAADDGTSQAYMHMLKPATVERGARVAAGQQIGQVGETGRATGCHLHFELWTAPGWYTGGKPVDPLPALQAWAARG